MSVAHGVDVCFGSRRGGWRDVALAFPRVARLNSLSANTGVVASGGADVGARGVGASGSTPSELDSGAGRSRQVCSCRIWNHNFCTASPRLVTIEHPCTCLLNMFAYTSVRTQAPEGVGEAPGRQGDRAPGHRKDSLCSFWHRCLIGVHAIHRPKYPTRSRSHSGGASCSSST